MNKFYFITIITTTALLVSCQIEPILYKQKHAPVTTSEEGVVMSVSPILFEDGTKASLSSDESSGLSFTWDEGDATGVYSSTDGFARFSLVSGDGCERAVFDGAGFMLSEGATYYAFYPYMMAAADKTSIPVSYRGQIAVSDGDEESVMDYDYLFSSAVADAGGNASFGFSHVGAFLRMGLTLDTGTPIDSVSIVPMYGEVVREATLDLTNGSLSASSSSLKASVSTDGLSVPAGGTFTFWQALAPQDFHDDAFSVFVYSGSNLYTARKAGRSFNAGKAYRWNLSPVLEGSEPGLGFASVTDKGQFTASDVPSGQYSGIAWLGGSAYAVVDDKLYGGGLVNYDITLDSEGIVTAVTSSTMAGTAASGVSGRDNEGIAFIPGTPGTLFVSSEADQQIREYDLDGYPTGRSISVPADMSTGKITSNKGFEALTYNDAQRLFWTITESALSKDVAPFGDLLRLQSFDGSSLLPAARYFYRPDAPSKTTEEAAAASSYVFGVPALAAMDDGRILVLEREVYVPNGNAIQKALYSFTKVKIYVVNPGSDPAGILQKSLVASFQTNAVNLANYEGMCLGPTLADGSRVLLLVPDSQGGSGGLTKEYVKSIVLK